MSFESWCGGLPHPDNADNPLKYKFRYEHKVLVLLLDLIVQKLILFYFCDGEKVMFDNSVLLECQVRFPNYICVLCTCMYMHVHVYM